MLKELTKNYREAKAELKGEAISKAVRIKPLEEIDPNALQPNQPARPTQYLFRRPDGTPVRYWSDGSLRHATGHKPGKAARKALKRARREARRGPA